MNDRDRRLTEARIEGENAELARLAVAGDPAAWQEIFERHYRAVYAFVRHRVAPAQAAEDLASQTFEVAYARRAAFDYRGVPIAGWLIGIARNLVRDHQKKLFRRGFEEELPAEPGVASDDHADLFALQHDLATGMAQLTEDQRTVLSLRFLLDWPVADTARAMDRSEEAVRTLQRRALLALRQVLEAQERAAGDAR